MTVTDVWRLILDVFSFVWVPAWMWWGFGIVLLLSVPVGLTVGRVIRHADRQAGYRDD